MTYEKVTLILKKNTMKIFTKLYKTAPLTLIYNICLNIYLNYKVVKFTRENVSEELYEKIFGFCKCNDDHSVKDSRTNILQHYCKPANHTLRMASRLTSIDAL